MNIGLCAKLVIVLLVSYDESCLVYRLCYDESPCWYMVRPHQVISLFLIKTLVGFWPFFKEKNKNLDFFPGSARLEIMIFEGKNARDSKCCFLP